MKIKDRGVIKWTSLMLPEHVKMLRDWKLERHWELEKMLDEHKNDELDEILKQSFESGDKLEITYYDKINFKHEIIIGNISGIDILAGIIWLENSDGKTVKVSSKAVVDIKLI
ncbi:MAG: YolD-like family protein [Bacillales bacterium]|jgi:hypothetical protein|nr:YolD-like family protein [Bacillales bacterium]